MFGSSVILAPLIMNKKAVVLLSGGLDSTVTLYQALNKGYKCHALIFDYKQRHQKEKLFAVNLAKKLKITYDVIKIELPWGGSALTDDKLKVPKNQKLGRKGVPITYVPGRNSIFLSFAFSCAEAIKAESIFIGAHVQDYSGYPDCRPDYIKLFAQGVNKGLACKTIKIKAPLLNLTKAQIIKRGLKYNVDFSKTWSCYSGTVKPCCKCDSCRYRMTAFAELNMTDPAIMGGL